LSIPLQPDAKNKEMFLKYIRLAKFNNDFYVKTECRAQMKRAVTYKVDIAIDEHGSIVDVYVNVMWGWDQMHVYLNIIHFKVNKICFTVEILIKRRIW
jgi:hypothetical protein